MNGLVEQNEYADCGISLQRCISICQRWLIFAFPTKLNQDLLFAWQEVFFTLVMKVSMYQKITTFSWKKYVSNIFFFFYIFTHFKKNQRSIKIFLLNKYVFLSWQFLHCKKYFKALSKSLIKYSKIYIFLSHFEFNDIYLYSLSTPLLIAFIDLSDIYAKQRRPNQVCRNTFSLPWVFLEEHHWLSLQPQTGSRPDINLCLLIFHWCNFF